MQHRDQSIDLVELFDRAMSLSGHDRDAFLQNEVPPEYAVELEGLLDEVDIEEASPQTLADRSDYPEVDGYRVLERIAQGGFADVFRAKEVDSGRIVAIKLLHLSSYSNRKRLLREAKLIQEIKHPNVVQLIRSGEIPRGAYLVLEFVEGGTLKEKLGGRRWQSREAAELLYEVSSSLHRVHERGIVHRDLKPSNILLTADGRPKIADFGLAKSMYGGNALDDESVLKTRTGAILGTPHYMSPEQANGYKDIDARTDLYSLGIVLYEMIAGRRPFEGDSDVDVINLVRDRSQHPEFPLGEFDSTDELQTICRQCTAKSTEHRYQTAGQLAEDLRRYLDREPVLAKAPPTQCDARSRFPGARLIVVLLLTILLLFSLFRPNRQSSVGAVTEVDSNELRIGIWRWPGYAPFRVLEVLSKENPELLEGLNLRLVVMEDGIVAARQKLEERDRYGAHKSSDDIDASMCVVDAHVRTRGEQIPAAVVLKLDESLGADGFVTHQDVETLADLSDQEIGFVANEPPHFLLLAYCQQRNLSLKQLGLRLRPCSASEAAANFIDGKYAGAITWEPHLSNAREKVDGKLLLTSADLPGEIVDILCVHEDYLERRSENVAKLIRGWFRAVALLESGDPEAIQIAEDFVDPNDEIEMDFVGMCQGMKFASVADNFEFFDEFENQPNQFQQLMRRAETRIRKETNYLSRDVDPEESDRSDIFKQIFHAERVASETPRKSGVTQGEDSRSSVLSTQ